MLVNTSLTDPGSLVPTFDQLLSPALEALRAMGGSASNEELLAKVLEITGVSDEVASVIHTDHRQTKFSYNLAWAKTYLKRAGAVENSVRGVWSITEHGESMVEAEVRLIPTTVRREDYERRRVAESVQADAAEDLPDEEQSSRDWKAALLSTLQSMPPDAFERLAQRMLRDQDSRGLR